jgi:ankyrin repeat protein
MDLLTECENLGISNCKKLSEANLKKRIELVKKGKGLQHLTVPALKKIAKEEKVRIGKKSKEDLIAEIKAARKGKVSSPKKSPVKTKKSPVKTKKSPVKPKKSPVKPKKSPVKPKKSPVKPKKSPVKPKKSPVKPKKSPVKPKKSPVKPKKSPVKPKKSPVKPKKSPVKPKKSPVKPKKEVIFSKNIPYSDEKLSEAINDGDVETLEKMEMPDVPLTSVNKFDILETVVELGNVEILSELLKNWSFTVDDLRNTNDKEQTILMIAIEKGDIPIIKELRKYLDKKDILKYGDGRDDGLMYAVRHKNGDILKEFKDNWNVTIDEMNEDENEDEQSILHVAAEYGNVDAIKLLREWGYHLYNNVIDDQWLYSPLHYAAEHGHVNVIKEFRKHWGEDIWTPEGEEPENWGLILNDMRRGTVDGDTPLSLAAEKGHIKVLQEFKDNWNMTKEDINSLLEDEKVSSEVKKILNEWLLEISPTKKEVSAQKPWLSKSFEGIIPYSYEEFINAINEGDIAILKNMEMPNPPLSQDNKYYILNNVVFNSTQEILDQLMDFLGFTTDDLAYINTEENSSVLLNAIKSCNIDVIRKLEKYITSDQLYIEDSNGLNAFDHVKDCDDDLIDEIDSWVI